MKLLTISAISACLLVSCAEPTKKPAGPTSNSSMIPWNAPIAGQGAGQFGMLPQNQVRR